ncbi:corticotropin-releasing factor-binding protein [Protopterus annectens]|uniref:corticotropin-releasing factor-binding protein n=1 Tax=Protopterus annectens TaxID=7888 RepID=UPI001CFB12A5|nr:corticotropin-releasing factor-binding protein [Protopterus annectens]
MPVFTSLFGSSIHTALLLILTALRGEARYIEKNGPVEEDRFSLWRTELKRELTPEHLYHRSLKCIDMVSVEGQFTFNADQPQLHCAIFFIGDPEELISIEYSFTNLDCQGGDLFKIFDGWIMNGEKFPSSIDHPLSTSERYVDLCDSGNIGTTITSSQNVAMLFFRVHSPGNGFTIIVKKINNLFPCNVISQSPNGRFTLLVPHLHRNCSFSIIYPVELEISELTLGHFNDLLIKKQAASCSGQGDFVELLGGNGLDPSKMHAVADLCYSFNSPAQMKIGCDNSVVRMVSSGKYINRVTIEYRQIDLRELPKPKGNSIESFCFPTD